MIPGFSVISILKNLIIVAVTLLRDLVERLATGIGHAQQTHDKGDEQQDYHAISCQGKALAIVTVDEGEDESPDCRETTHDEEHQSLGTGTELGWEQL